MHVNALAKGKPLELALSRLAPILDALFLISRLLAERAESVKQPSYVEAKYRQ